MRLSISHYSYIDYDGHRDQEHVIPGQLSQGQDAAISLPSSLFKTIDSSKNTNIGMFFGFYDTAILFPVSQESTESDGNEAMQRRVCSHVLAATVGRDIDIRNLGPEENVTISFRLLQECDVVSFISPVFLS